MRVLIIKTSSMGDIFHTFPALSDAQKHFATISFDWVVEENFAELPTWHPLVNAVIPVALRRWRKQFFSKKNVQEWKNFRNQINKNKYDVILDAQGLVKSAFLTLFASGRRAGLDWRSAREPLASFFYQSTHTVNFYQHAVLRMRSLFAKSLNYPMPSTAPDFGLSRKQFMTGNNTEKYIVFLHGTTWESKQWPNDYWVALTEMAKKAGFKIKISGSHNDEKKRADYLSKKCSNVDVIHFSSIKEIAKLLSQAQASVAVDTGLGHLSAALGVPTVSIYGSTNPDYTGALGKNSVHLKAKFSCSPCLNRICHYKKGPLTETIFPACYSTVTPEKVWEAMCALLL